MAHFNVNPLYRQSVESATYDSTFGRWLVEARNTSFNKVEKYIAKFLVVAPSKNSEDFGPNIIGLENFSGNVVRSRSSSQVEIMLVKLC